SSVPTHKCTPSDLCHTVGHLLPIANTFVKGIIPTTRTVNSINAVAAQLTLRIYRINGDGLDNKKC
ncbi:MAG: hypothetical protein WB474_01785, partial [Nitrososphaeraceae archaeon]